MKKFLAMTGMAILLANSGFAEPNSTSTQHAKSHQSADFSSEKNENLMKVNEKKQVLLLQNSTERKVTLTCTNEEAKAEGAEECGRLVATEFKGVSLYEKGRSKIFPYRNIAPSLVEIRHEQQLPMRPISAVYRSHCSHQMVGYSSLRMRCR